VLNIPDSAKANALHIFHHPPFQSSTPHIGIAIPGSMPTLSEFASTEPLLR